MCTQLGWQGQTGQRSTTSGTHVVCTIRTTITLHQVGQVSLQPRTAVFHQTQPAAPDKPVKVSLHDCLACSGCVTSAETVLLEQQSAEELMARLAPADGPRGAVVVSISPQTRASLAALHSVSPLAAFRYGLADNNF